jgi:hypothetical protein
MDHPILSCTSKAAPGSSKYSSLRRRLDDETNRKRSKVAMLAKRVIARASASAPPAMGPMREAAVEADA